MKADAVFEGGGVKGVAFIGAIEVMEKYGYQWEKLAGTSAGSIVAALLSAGYRSSELYPIFLQLNYQSFLKRSVWNRIPVIGPVVELLMNQGMYSCFPLEVFVDQLLRQKGVSTFGDIPQGNLRIIVSDITAGRMLIFPDDLKEFGIDPNRFSIARAVRMSSSIPYFFRPSFLYRGSVKHCLVDGGLLSNFPVWLFDVPGVPRWPTFGFRLKSDLAPQETNIKGMFSYTKALISTMLDAHDRFYVKKAHAIRTIFIPTFDVKATQFSLNRKTKEKLYQSGKEAATAFLKSWDFQTYVKMYRRPSA